MITDFNIVCFSFNASKSYVFGDSSCTRTNVDSFNTVLDLLPDDFSFIHAAAYDAQECQGVLDRLMDYDVCR